VTFLHPWVLLGALAAGIPIILHLIARRQPPTVVFPAVRYLVATTKEHQRRLKLRNILLLLVRTALILFLVMAAAGPTVPLQNVPGHLPSALVVILDNSPSSAAIVDGRPRLDTLRSAARSVVDRAGPDDALWLMTADGVVRSGDRGPLNRAIDSAGTASRRLDLGQAIGHADAILAAEERPGEIFLVSDLQASAVTDADPSAPLVVVRPEDGPPPNRGLASLTAGSQPWPPEGGRIVARVVGDSGPPTAITLRAGDRPERQALVVVGSPVALSVSSLAPGWWPVRATLAPDELLADDERSSLVRVAPAARATWDPADRYIATAAQVLAANRRLVAGPDVSLGLLGPGRSVVMPPSDPARLGAVNRALERRGSTWTYGSLVVATALTDSSALLGRVAVKQRYALVSSSSGRTGVVATVAGDPWLVRSGDIILLGSRLDPAWTDLPLSAGFMPFMDVLLNRVARGELASIEGAPGEPVFLPDRVTVVVGDARVWEVEGGAPFRPPEVGLYFLMAEEDTVGSLAVNIDPRESLLAPAGDREVRRLWRPTRILGPQEAAGAAFSAAAGGDLRGPLLWLVVGLALFEVFLASGRRREA